MLLITSKRFPHTSHQCSDDRIFRATNAAYCPFTSDTCYCLVYVQFVLVFTWVDYSPARYGSYVYPAWADGLGWLMSFAVVVWIPVYAIVAVRRQHDDTVLQVGGGSTFLYTKFVCCGLVQCSIIRMLSLIHI